MFEGTKKILVIKLRHIGDVLLTVPAIRALKESFPESGVSALVNSGTEDMLTLNPLVDEVFCFDRADIKSKGAIGRIPGEMRLLNELKAKKFDMTVDLTGGDRPAILGLLSGARYRLGYEPAGGFAGKKFLYTHRARRPVLMTHTVLRDLGLLREFGIDTKDLTVNIFTSPDDDAYVDKELREKGVGRNEPFVHVHPASRWMFKCWTDEGTAYIMDALGANGYRTVITSGPGDDELKKVRSIIRLMKIPPVDLSGRLKLKHLASLSRRAAFFLGVDSAPMHIAAAAGARVIGIFGPSGAFNWGPWDNAGAAPGAMGTPYPLKSGVQYFGGNIVIQKDWDCIPCGEDGCDGSKKSECLEKLEPSFVWGIIKKALDENAGM